jgi:acyl-CoA synthetase (AMP-forming)/AMP-acid ligase II
MTEPDTAGPHPLSKRIAAVLGLAPESRAIEFDRQWHPWGLLSDSARRIAALTAAAGRPEVGILLRNRPEHVAAVLGVLIAGGCVVTVNPSRGETRTRADLDALDLPIIVGAAEDLPTFVPRTARAAVVPTTALTQTPPPTALTLDGPAPGRPGVAVRMLTSGTTGTPKRVDLGYDMLARSVLGASMS